MVPAGGWDSLAPVRTPAVALSELVSQDATRPFLTCYDDTSAPDRPERVELSRRVVGTWVNKAANALQESLDVEPGTVVLLDLPAPHWRLAYWALAVWSVGATVTLDPHEGADVLVTADPGSTLVDDADEVVVVTLDPLAREHPGGLRSGMMDEAKELSSFGDGFTPWDEPEPGDTALVHDGTRVAYADLVPAPDWPPGTRALVTTTSPRRFLDHLAQALAVGGSLVLVRGTPPAPDDPRVRAEQVDLVVPD